MDMIKEDSKTEKLIILGSGPAGLTAAIYAARADLAPLLVHGSQPGGQLTTTTDVENYPGFPDGLMGPDMMERFTKQAERFGTRFIQDEVVRVDLGQRPFLIETGSGKTLRGESLICATGATAKLLGLDRESELMGRGVSACATCDGFFFRDQDVAVVGGGDTAAEEASFLTKFASSVTIIHRRDKLRASMAMQHRLRKNDKIKFLWDSSVEKLEGKTQLEHIKVKNLKTNEVSDLLVTGLFYGIGHQPNTSLFKDFVDMDDLGYIKTIHHTKTKVEGFFVAGDAQDHEYRQAVTAAGSGCMAALDAERFLEAQKA